MSGIDNNKNKDNDIISPERYVFWMNDVTVLFRDGNYIRFVPTSDMTRVEQLNAATRFFLYLIIILFLFDKTDEFMYIPIIGIIMVIILYNVFEIDEKGKREELLRMKRRKESMRDLAYKESLDNNYRTYQVDDDGDVVTIDIDEEEHEKYLEEKDAAYTGIKIKPNYELEAGYYDSNGKLHVGPYYAAVRPLSKTERDKEIKYSLSEMRLYENAKCPKPTVNNPFVNPTVSDFNTENIPVPVNSDDDEIQKDMKLKYNEDMYRDIEDVFDRQNSQRQFYTVAHNIPNDMEAFGRWCYKFPPTCKTNQERCLRYQDLRMQYPQ